MAKVVENVPGRLGEANDQKINSLGLPGLFCPDVGSLFGD